jgi:Transcriptional regulators
MEFESLKKENLSNLVKENLKLYFVKNNLRGGDPLPSEAELATSLGVSRTSVREGLKSLESLGIIEVHPGIGRFLRKFNFDSILENLTYSIEMEVRDFRDILEVRIALESAFIGDNIDRYTDAQIKELEDIISANAETRFRWRQRGVNDPDYIRFFILPSIAVSEITCF